jgi:hypothetical protein
MSDLAPRRLLLLLALAMSLSLGLQVEPGDGEVPVGRLHVVAVAAAAVGGGLPGGVAATALYAAVRHRAGQEAATSSAAVTAVRLLVGLGVSAIVAGLVHAVDLRDARIARLEDALLARQRGGATGGSDRSR